MPPPAAQSAARFGPYHMGYSMALDTWASGTLTGSSNAGQSTITLQGDSRAYLIGSHENGSLRWADLKYAKLKLLNKTLRWTVDVSNVGCGCNAALYLVAMSSPLPSEANYCDINTAQPCLEIDLFEGNAKALAATLHTTTTKACDGTCNKWGCSNDFKDLRKNGVTWSLQDLVGGERHTEHTQYGRSALTINTNWPFEVSALFDGDGRMSIRLKQAGKEMELYSPYNAHICQDLVSAEAHSATKTALEQGVVLITSLWSAEGDGMAWLDGGCNSRYHHCDLKTASVMFGNLFIGDPPSPSPPSVLLPPATPPGSCYIWLSAACAQLPSEKWIRDTWGEANANSGMNRVNCERSRRSDYADYCQVSPSTIVMHFNP